MSETAEHTLRVELIKLLKADAEVKAVPLISTRDLSTIWCDKAVAVFVRCGRVERAREIIAWAKEHGDIITWHNCLLEYAEGLLRKHLASSGKSSIVFGQATGDDAEVLREVIDVLSPIVDHAKADQRVSTPLERTALVHTINATLVLGETETLKPLCVLLRECRPIPLEYVRLALSRLVPSDGDIAQRLCLEHKDNFEATLLALMVESELNGNAEAAFEQGLRLRDRPSSDSERRDLCGLLFQISQQVGVPAIERAKAVAEELLGSTDLFVHVIAAALQLRQGCVQAAKSILEHHKNAGDAQWLQLYAHCLFSENNFTEGLEYFSKALERLPSVEMHKILGEAAVRGGFIDKAILAYDAVVRANPADAIARAQLAHLYVKANDYEDAEEHLQHLWENDKGNVSYGMNYAACLANLGRIDNAIAIYKSLCTFDKAPVEAVVAVAQLYRSKHQSDESFRFLEQRKQTWWDNPVFLLAYVDAGYASAQEAQAHEAFCRILELQRKGQAPPDIIQGKTLDDILEHRKLWTQRTEHICKMLVQGKLPWLLADDFQNHAAIMGWAIRTQPLTWLSDDIVSRASYSIYATNGFHARGVDGKRQLAALAEPIKGEQVVIDLSALITLCRLNLLDETMHFFGEIYISSRYTSHLMAQAHRLEFHQLSHVKSGKFIRGEIDSGRVSALSDAGTPGIRPYPYVHEYTDDNIEHYYRLRDVCEVLHNAGRITDDKYRELLRIAAKPPGEDDTHAPLRYGDQIILELSTLRTLVNHGVYKALKDCFVLSIMSDAKESLDSDLRAIAYQEECQKWHDDLLARLSQYETLHPNYDTEEKSDVCLDSYFLAKSKDISLLADDRVIHALALNDTKFKGRAFGVDCLLKAFERDNILESARCDAAILQLIKWRYRFLVPSLECLLRIAKQHQGNPPGSELMEVAAYVHDCMRDPGLFAGPENTDPPIPMCGRLYATWSSLIVKFVSHVWKDAAFTPPVATTLTKWALQKCLPSPPRAFLPQLIGRISGAEQLLFERLLSDLVFVEDMSRAQTAVSSIRETCRMSDKELYRVLADTLDRIAESHEEDAVPAIQRRLCLMTLGEKVDVRTYVHLIKHGLEKSEKMKEDSSFVLRAVREPRSPEAIQGPLFFYKRGTVRHAVSVSHALLSVSQEVRQAAIDYLLAAKTADSMSPQSLATVGERRQTILQKPRKQWIPAAVELSDLLEEDWLLNYHGVRQAVQTNFGEGVDDYLSRVLRPNIPALGYMGRGILRPSEQGEEIVGQLREIAAEECAFRTALEKYYQSYGHVPLCHDMSIIRLYNEWNGKGKEIGDIWQVFWEWADSSTSPIPRYHACYFFLHNPTLIPHDKIRQLVEETLAIISPSKEAKGQWYEPWRTLADLARYYVEYLESGLPGANSEMVATHSWWLADRVASLFRSDPGDATWFREKAFVPESDRAAFAWQCTRLATSPSAFRYTTLYMHNVWSLSLVSQFSPDMLKAILSVATEAQKKYIYEAVSGNLVNLFPTKHPGEKRVYAFDEGCLGGARALTDLAEEPQSTEMLAAFIEAVVKVTGEAGIETSLKRLPEANAADRLLIVHAVQAEACMDGAPKELIWNHLTDYEWVKRVFGTLSPATAEHFFDGLKEIQIRTRGNWDQQLPHLYARLCEDFREDGERRSLFFAFTIISSLAAGSVSALDRLLKGVHRFKFREDLDDWRQRIEGVASLTPRWSRARLRAILASLHT